MCLAASGKVTWVKGSICTHCAGKDKTGIHAICPCPSNLLEPSRKERWYIQAVRQCNCLITTHETRARLMRTHIGCYIQGALSMSKPPRLWKPDSLLHRTAKRRRLVKWAIKFNGNKNEPCLDNLLKSPNLGKALLVGSMAA